MPRALLRSRWALPFQLAVAVAAIAAIVGLSQRRYRIARVAAVVQVSLILWGWAFAQFPFVLPDELTIRDAAAPEITLRLVLIGLAGGAIVLIPSLRYLFRVFPTRGRTS
jgi:cytochrome d ubiquinol oxidase subunit II